MSSAYRPIEQPRPPESRGIPAWGKALIVSGAGCGVIVVAVIAAFGVFVLWMLAPGSQIDTNAIIGEQSEAVFAFDNTGGDSGVADLATSMFLEMQKAQNEAQREKVPESLRWLVDLQGRQSRQSAGMLWMYIPRQVTVTVEGKGGDWLRNTYVAANLPMFSGMVKMMAWPATKAGRSRSHGGHEYWIFKDGGGLCFAGGTILWSQMGESMPELLDRIEAGGGGGPLRGEMERLASEDVRGDFIVALDNAHHVLDWLLAEGEAAERPVGLPGPVGAGAPAGGEQGRGEEAEGAGGEGGTEDSGSGGEEPREGLWGAVESGSKDLDVFGWNIMVLGSDVVSEDRITGELVCTFDGEEEAERASEVLAGLKKELGESAGAKGLSLAGKVQREGTRVEVKYRVSGIVGAMQRFWAEAAKEMEDEPEPR